MTERDFAYWLQGYFELASASWDKLGWAGEGDFTLNTSQVKCIQSHIDLVRTTQKTSVLLTAIEVSLEHNTLSVQKVIASYFEHVIDPQHPDQDAANAAHSGATALNHGSGMRC